MAKRRSQVATLWTNSPVARALTKESFQPPSTCAPLAQNMTIGGKLEMALKNEKGARFAMPAGDKVLIQPIGRGAIKASHGLCRRPAATWLFALWTSKYIGRSSRCRLRIERASGLGEQPAHHGLESFQRHRFQLRIERRRIVLLAELEDVVPPRMAAQLIALVAVGPQVVEPVVALHDAVILDDPVVLLGDEGFEQGGGQLGVIERGERVADIVQQRAHHVLFIAAVAV